MNGNLTSVLGRSKVYQSYTRAFRDVTGLSLSLCPLEGVLRSRIKDGKGVWNCETVGQPHCNCRCCSKAFARWARKPFLNPDAIHIAKCPCGTLVPVRSGRDLTALLKVGPPGVEYSPAPYASKTSIPPSESEVGDRASKDNPGCSKHRMLSTKRYRSAVKLVGIFAQQLSGLCNQLVVQEQAGEPAIIQRAKQFIQRNQVENLSSSCVAKELHISRFYFCTLFKKVTGVTFTEYVTRMRIERVKELLMNPNLRVSEIAYEVGFQSLTHFNRAFLKLTGQSPTEYRKRFRAI